jgi:hypothetical protein
MRPAQHTTGTVQYSMQRAAPLHLHRRTADAGQRSSSSSTTPETARSLVASRPPRGAWPSGSSSNHAAARAFLRARAWRPAATLLPCRPSPSSPSSRSPRRCRIGCVMGALAIVPRATGPNRERARRPTRGCPVPQPLLRALEGGGAEDIRGEGYEVRGGGDDSLSLVPAGQTPLGLGQPVYCIANVGPTPRAAIIKPPYRRQPTSLGVSGCLTDHQQARPCKVGCASHGVGWLQLISLFCSLRRRLLYEWQTTTLQMASTHPPTPEPPRPSHLFRQCLTTRCLDPDTSYRYVVSIPLPLECLATRDVVLDPPWGPLTVVARPEIARGEFVYTSTFRNQVENSLTDSTDTSRLRVRCTLVRPEYANQSQLHCSFMIKQPAFRELLRQ